MMRQIKFRIWNDINKEMEDVREINLIDDANVSVVTKNDTHFTIIKDVTRTQLREWTGIADKTGVDIYEGDFIESDEIIGVVGFKNGSFVVTDNNGRDAILFELTDVVILGNCI